MSHSTPKAHESLQDESKLVFLASGDDSGNFTFSSAASDCSLPFDSEPEPGPESNTGQHMRQMLCQKEQALSLAMQDVRRLRSELERLSKSEQWYRQELRLQKSTRLEDLERIYSQERQYMAENQRLQRECVRLYGKCGELEKELDAQRQQSLRRLQGGALNVEEEPELAKGQCCRQLELEQQQALIDDQEQLIKVLRKQKYGLLEELRQLSAEKDEKVVQLQRMLADLELDNRRMTGKCKVCFDERKALETALRDKESTLRSVEEEKLGLERCIADLREQLETQRQLVELKEREAEDLQTEFGRNMRNETDLDEVHRLSMTYYQELSAKTTEIVALKKAVSALQLELSSLSELQAQNEEQQRVIENLNFTLEARQLELKNLHQTDALKSARLAELQLDIEHVREEREAWQTELVGAQAALARVQEELLSTNEQYVHVRDLCERTRFELEMLEIEQRKLRFRSESDQQEIADLRERLQDYMAQTAQLSDQIRLLEKQLDVMTQENRVVKEDFNKLQEEVRERTRESQGERAIGSESTDLDMSELLSASGKLEKQLQTQKEFLDEKRELMETFQGFLAQRGREDREKVEILVNENEILKEKLSEAQYRAHVLQLQQELREKGDVCASLQEDLLKQTDKVEDLRRQLLHNDAELYKVQRALREREEDSKDSSEQCQRLQVANQELQEELRKETKRKGELGDELEAARAEVLELRETLESNEGRQVAVQHEAVQTEEFSENGEPGRQTSKSDDFVKETEIEALTEKVQSLEEELRALKATDNLRREERVQLLSERLEQQSAKVQHLQDSQKDWEEVLVVLNTAQKLEESARRDLELKRAELEELNEAFAKQNAELRMLHELSAIIEQKRKEELEQLRQTFQREVSVMEDELREKCREVEEQKQLNELLRSQTAQNLEAVQCAECTENKAELEALRARVERTLEERDEQAARLQDLESELSELKRSRREALLLPRLVFGETDCNEGSPDKCSEDEGAEQTGAVEETVAPVAPAMSDDYLRILTKVLEGEYARKMSRYDQHIHSLLNNVKSLKRSLRANEQRTALLTEEQAKAALELQDMQKTRRSLEEMRLKYDQSQATIKELRQALEMERRKFEASDLGKSRRSEEATHEVANLIDDYKKLIQQSAVATQRPKTGAILELIQRSNRCVPDLGKVESHVDELRNDLQYFLANYSARLGSNPAVPSLLDELRAANEIF